MRRTSCSYRNFGRSRSRNWTRGRWLFRLQFGKLDFHRSLDGDAGDAFGFVDPGIALVLGPFVTGGLKFFGAVFRPICFVGRAARHRAEGNRDNRSKKNKKRYRPQPRGKEKARLLGMGECIFVVRHG